MDAGATCILGDFNSGVFKYYKSGSLYTQFDYANGTQFYWKGENRTDAIANPIQSASYVVDVVGSVYRMKNCTTGQIDVQDGNYTLVEQYAINNLTSGTVYLKEVLFNTSLTIPTNVVVIQSYRGIETTFPYRFSIMQITDTQYLARNYTSLYNDVCNWIVINAASYNLKMVIHTGDLVDAASNTTQWDIANNSMSLLLNNSIPYCWDAGNHDQTGASPNNTWLGLNYAAFNATAMETKSYWVSDLYQGKNTAVTFSVGTTNFLIINLEYWANSSAITWMTNLLNSYPTYRAIIATHSLLNGFDSLGDYQGRWWEENLETTLNSYPNVFLTLNGHCVQSARYASHRAIGTREEIFFNQQAKDANQGAATVRIYDFNLITGTVATRTYQVYGTSQFLNDAANAFNFPIGITGSSSGVSQSPVHFFSVNGITSSESTFGTANRTYLIPLYLPTPITLTAIGVAWGATTAQNFTVGLYYDMDNTPLYSPLIVNASAAKTGPYTIQELTVTSVTLYAGMYYLGVQSIEPLSKILRGSPTILYGSPTSQAYYYDTTVFGALTDPCPAVTASITVLVGGWLIGTPISS